MVMPMRRDKCYPGRGNGLKIPLLPEKFTSEPSRTLERVATADIQIVG